MSLIEALHTSSQFVHPKLSIRNQDFGLSHMFQKFQFTVIHCMHVLDDVLTRFDTGREYKPQPEKRSAF